LLDISIHAKSYLKFKQHYYTFLHDFFYVS